MSPGKSKKVAKYQMVRLPVDLLRALEEAGKANARTVPKEAEFRLRESLGRTGPTPAMSPWVRAVTETISRIAIEVDEIGVGPEVRFGMLYEAVSALLRQLRPVESQLNRDDEEMMRTLVFYLVQKIRRERSGMLEGLSED